MGRRIKISAGILNIRLHPHSPKIYADFMRAIYRLRTPVKIHGDRYAMISTLDRSEESEGIISGIITTFVNIDIDGNWFDTSNLKVATEEQVSEVKIPENLYPNASTFYFQMNTENHKIFVQTYSAGKTFTISSALKFFNAQSEILSILEDFGDAKITIVQSKEGLRRIFETPIIKELKITILKPNADIFSDNFEDEIEEHLANNQTQKLTFIYEADKGSSITPTAEVQSVSEIALENGNVEIKGKDETGAIRRSTNEFPRSLQDKFDPDEIGEKEAFRRLTK